MEVGGRFHVPTVLTPAPIRQKALCAPDSIWRLWRGDKSLFAAAILAKFLGYPVRRRVTILAELSRPLDQTELFFFLANVSSFEKLIHLKGEVVTVLN
jgi:hypothetical protein